MSLRPRYSLLTLLVLTALVAGGVKLWYGPHHVLERSSSMDYEVEYTYTRNMYGERNIHGPRIRRIFDNPSIARIEIHYFRDGTKLPWVICIYRVLDSKPYRLRPSLDPATECPLTPAENSECEALIMSEWPKDLPVGEKWLLFSGHRYALDPHYREGFAEDLELHKN